MKLSKIVLIAAGLLAFVGAAQAQTSAGSVPLREYTPNVTGAYAQAQNVTLQAARLSKARRVADLINGGHCGEAVKLAEASGDAMLARRAGEVCESPATGAAKP
jgi:hypothetical protein